MRKKYPQCRPNGGQNRYEYHNIGVNHCGEYECRKCSMGVSYKHYEVRLLGLIPLADLKKSLKALHVQGDWQLEWARMKILKQYISTNWEKFPEGIYSYDDVLGPNRKVFTNPNN